MNGWAVTLWVIVMFLIVIPFGAGRVVQFIKVKVMKKPNKPNEDIHIFVIGYLLSAVIFIVCAVVNLTHYTWEYDYTQKIAAIQDNNAYVISRYSADSTVYYHFMVDNGDHFKPRKVDQKFSIIRESEEEPKVVVYQQKPKNALTYWILPVEFTDSHKYEFYLPKGSVKQEFNIDLH